MKIAFFSPLLPVKSGISDYSEELLPHLAQYAEWTIVTNGWKPANKELSPFPVIDVAKFLKTKDRFDAVLYHMGNSYKCHDFIYETLLQAPGVVVMHDYIYHHFFAEMTVNRGLGEAYLAEMRHAHGEKGADAARKFIDGQIGSDIFFKFPLNRRIVDHASGIITHSKFIARRVKAVRPDVPVKVINLHLGPDPVSETHSAADLRRKHNLPEDAFIIGSFGFVTEPKRIHIALRSFKQLLEVHPNSYYVLVGELSKHYDIMPLIDELGIGDRVRFAGYVDLHAFHEYLHIVDVVINLRYPSAGETSASMIRTFGSGKPVILSDYAQFAEYPDDVCVKIPLDECEPDVLAAYLVAFVNDPALRDRLGQNAADYVNTHFTLDGSARRYYNFILDVAKREHPVVGEQVQSAANELDCAHYSPLVKKMDALKTELDIC